MSTYEPIVETELTLPKALAKVCKVSRTHCMLLKGSKETVKKIITGPIEFLMLAKDAEPRIWAIVDKAAKKNGIPIIPVESQVELGKIVDTESSGEKAMIKKCCVAAVQDYCEETVESEFVREYIMGGLTSQ